MARLKDEPNQVPAPISALHALLGAAPGDFNTEEMTKNILQLAADSNL